MKKIIFILMTVGSVLSCVSSYAQPVISATVETPAATTWVSKNAGDVVTINNGNASSLTITINVDKPVLANDGTQPAGINIKNCGSTSHIDAGSSAVCTTKDPANPVSFNSDSQINPVSGTYVIKQN